MNSLEKLQQTITLFFSLKLQTKSLILISFFRRNNMIKTKITFIIGTAITLLITYFSYKYLHYTQTPLIKRTSQPFFEGAETLDLRFNDFKYKAKGQTKSQAPVALIALDDESVREIGRWPWSRELIADMIEKALKYEVKSIAFDAIFSEPEISNPEADKKFSKIVTENPDKIILGTFSENQFEFKPYQDLCVAEAFLRTGGDQIVKINPGFTIDENTFIYDELNWAPLFETLFTNIRSLEEQKVLKTFAKNSKDELTQFQKNNLNSRLSEAMFYYCKTWLTEYDIFLKSEVIQDIEPLYKNIFAEKNELKNKAVVEVLEDIKKNYKPHPIPQYGEWTANIADIQNPANYTASFIAELDTDGVVRRYPLFFRSGDKLGSSFIPSLALQSYLLSGTYRAELKMKSAQNGEKSIQEFNIYDTSKNPEEKISSLPVDGSGQLLVNYYGPHLTLPYVSAKEFFNDKETMNIEYLEELSGNKQRRIGTQSVNKKDFLKGRSLIFGATATGIYDLRNTPMEVNYPGPEIHLTMLANLMENNHLKPWAKEAKLMPWIILILGLLFSLALNEVGSIASFLIFTGLMTTITAIDYWLFIKKQILIHSLPVYICIFGIFSMIQLYKYFIEERNKRELKSTFSKYVSPSVVDELLKDAKNLQLGGKKEHMTVFFSDVRGFTTISEKLKPEELSRVLNLYLTPMTEIVFQNSGTLDKYMGDAIMAFFGAPIKSPQHAKEACRCALLSIQKLYELQKQFAQEGLPHIDIGIGINTGEMSVGNMGSNIVQNYTVMGDSVNLASRLEGINKEYGTRIIISEFTYNEVKDSFVAREVDRVRVKGKLQPVKIYELLAEGKISDDHKRQLELYQKGYDLYSEKKFEDALAIFKDLHTLNQSDPVSELYIERCQDYLQEPPPQDWDGVFVMKTK